MRRLDYILHTLIVVGLLVGLGWLYMIDKVDSGDAILIYVMGQFISSYIRKGDKIWRIETPHKELPNQSKE